MIAFSFGPYVFPQYGIRSEHIIIYLLLPVSVVIMLLKLNTSYVHIPVVLIITIMAFNIIWTSAVSSFGGYSPESSYKAISHFENYFQPIAVILIVYSITINLARSDLLKLIKISSYTLIVLLCINTLISVLFLFIDLSVFIQPFVMSGVGGEGSVAYNAYTMGRITGIINQPMENGLLYSLGLLAWAYITRICNPRRFLHYLSVFLLLLGGVLAVSKIFIFGGIPLFLVYLTPSTSFRLLFKRKFLATAISGAVSAIFLVSIWTGWERLFGYFIPSLQSKGLLYFYTSGRFGGQNTFVQTTFQHVMETSPVYGFGFGTSSLLDSGFLEFFLQGGAVSLFCYLILLFMFFHLGITAYRHHRARAGFMLALFVLISGASLGAPVITINRFSPVLWIFIVLLIVSFRDGSKVKPGPRRATAVA